MSTENFTQGAKGKKVIKKFQLEKDKNWSLELW